mgnify:CR=1 FL=1
MSGKIAYISLLLTCAAASAFAEPYPSKPITIVVPAAAGGPSDTVARVLAPALTKELKQTVIVENQGGAGGTVGAGRVARAPGDGYTLYLYHIAHSTWPALYRKLSFDVVKAGGGRFQLRGSLTLQNQNPKGPSP